MLEYSIQIIMSMWTKLSMVGFRRNQANIYLECTSNEINEFSIVVKTDIERFHLTCDTLQGHVVCIFPTSVFSD